MHNITLKSTKRPLNK